MDLFMLVIIAFLCFALCFIVPLTVYTHLQHRKYAHIPGPPNKGIKGFYLGQLPHFAAEREKGSFFSEIICPWQLEYGRVFVVFFLHMHIIVTCDLAAVKELLVTGGHPKSKTVYRDMFYLFGQRFLGHGLVTELNHDRWAKRRLQMNPTFHRAYLKSLIAQFNATADTVMEELVKVADGQTTFKMIQYMNRVTLDVIGKVAFHMDIDSIHDESSPFPDAIFATLNGISFVLNNFFRSRLMPWADREFKKKVHESLKLLRKTGVELIENRETQLRRGDTVPDDILTQICRYKVNDPDFDIEAALDDFVTFFIAGQETTANTMSFILMELGRRPDVLQKLRDEVDSLIGDKSMISYDDVMNLEYSGMVIKESLRLYPPGGQTAREVAKDNFDIAGYHIPKGSDVLISMYAVGRNPEYHEDPLTFDPERFHPKSSRRPSMYTYFPFSLGPRNCLGQTFAQIEAKILLAKFVQKFNIHLDMTQSFDILEVLTLKPKDGCRCALTLREK